MSKRDDLIEKYSKQLKDADVAVDLALLTKVTIGLGPSIYKADAETVSGSDAKELETVKTNYLMKKLGLADGSKLDDALNKVVGILGKSNRNKYRACFYYLLCIEFKKESVYR
jgi:hypothetical protein